MPCKGSTTNMSAFYIRDVTKISSKYNKYAGNETARDLFWFYFYLFKCNLTKLTTTSLAVKRSTSLTVKWFTSLAVKQSTSLAVHKLSGQAVHKLSGQAAHERSGHPAVNPISAGSHGLW